MFLDKWFKDKEPETIPEPTYTNILYIEWTDGSTSKASQEGWDPSARPETQWQGIFDWYMHSGARFYEMQIGNSYLILDKEKINRLWTKIQKSTST